MDEKRERVKVMEVAKKHYKMCVANGKLRILG